MSTGGYPPVDVLVDIPGTLQQKLNHQSSQPYVPQPQGYHCQVDISVKSGEFGDGFEFLTSSGQGPSLGEDDDMPGPLYTKGFGPLHGEEALVKVLYESLGPSSMGRVRFPKLMSSHFSLRFNSSMYSQKRTLVLGLKHCLRRVLKSRSKCGATQLTLQEAIQVENGKQYGDDDPPFKCNFWLQRGGGGNSEAEMVEGA